MRVGIVTTWFERGAAYVSRQYRDVLSKDNDVFVFARGGEEQAQSDPKWDDPRVTWGIAPYTNAHNAVDLGQFRRWITSNRLEVVFFNEQTWWPPVVLAKDLGVVTGTYVDYYTERTVPLFAAFDFLICNTKRHYSVFGWHSQAIHVPWGTDLQLFSPRGFEVVARDRPTFFHSCGMSPHRKGTDIVLKAFSGMGDRAHLVIHSQVSLRSSYPGLRTTIDTMERRGALRIHEGTVGAPGLFHQGDVYVYPTRLEGIGLTIMEAMACGLPAIVPDVGPMNEFVEDRKTGMLVPGSRLVARHDGYYWPQNIVDPDAVREALVWFVDHLSDLPAMKRATRQYAEANLDWRRNAARLGEIFHSARRLSPSEAPSVREEIERFESGSVRQHAVSLKERLWIYWRQRHPAVGRVLDRLRGRSQLEA